MTMDPHIDEMFRKRMRTFVENILKERGDAIHIARVVEIDDESIFGHERSKFSFYLQDVENNVIIEHEDNLILYTHIGPYIRAGDLIVVAQYRDKYIVLGRMDTFEHFLDEDISRELEFVVPSGITNRTVVPTGIYIPYRHIGRRLKRIYVRFQQRALVTSFGVANTSVHSQTFEISRDVWEDLAENDFIVESNFIPLRPFGTAGTVAIVRMRNDLLGIAWDNDFAEPSKMWISYSPEIYRDWEN